MTDDAADETTTPWLPTDFEHPTRLDLPTGHHLRPIRATDIDLDYPAVMGSRDRLWEIFGLAWGWPPDTMTRDADHDDLARHEREIEAHESFNYAIFGAEEDALLGCVYIDPPEFAGADAEICWWVVDDIVGSDLDELLEVAIPVWISAEWPLRSPRYIGRDLTWAEWREQAGA